jgi:hypothetical protein
MTTFSLGMTTLYLSALSLIAALPFIVALPFIAALSLLRKSCIFA